MFYLILALVALIAALGIYYFNYVYPVLDDNEDFMLPDDLRMRKTMAGEYAGACSFIIALCAILALFVGAASW